MNRGFRYFFSISPVFLFTIVIYFMITGAPLSAPAVALSVKPHRTGFLAGLPAEAWDKVRQTLEQDGLEGALTAGPDAQTMRLNKRPDCGPADRI